MKKFFVHKLTSMLTNLVGRDLVIQAVRHALEYIEKQIAECDNEWLELLLDGELFKRAADKALDYIEEKVIASPTQFDDKLILPALDLIRQSFNIPDNDLPSE